MMAGKAFLDTNIVLRAFHDVFPEHGQVRQLLDQLIDEEVELWISRQVIREYLVQVTHPATVVQSPPLDAVLRQMQAITSVCHVADDTESVTIFLYELLASFPTRGKQIHDANVVATMLAYGLDTLVTLNVADMKRFQSRVRIVTVGEIASG